MAFHGFCTPKTAAGSFKLDELVKLGAFNVKTVYHRFFFFFKVCHSICYRKQRHHTPSFKLSLRRSRFRKFSYGSCFGNSRKQMASMQS